MVTFVGLALIVAAIVAAVVIVVLAAPLLTSGEAGTRCERCGATIPHEADGCSVCEAPFKTGLEDDEDPIETARDRDKAPKRVYVDLPQADPEDGVINEGVPRGIVKVAGVVFLVGLSTRVVGMLEPAGLELGVPQALATLLTVVGGVAMFASFVVLDVA